MIDQLKAIPTRFRAYQLGSEGSSFSYWANGHFTLIEGRLTQTNHATLRAELHTCNKASIDTLHITSWDQDHCSLIDLQWILKNLAPRRIEYPGYEGDSESAGQCSKELSIYRDARVRNGLPATIQAIDPVYIKSLGKAQDLGYKDLIYHPRELYDKSNDNSTVKLFRSGMFNVASLGDIEDNMIGAGLRNSRIFQREVDVLILAHHGSNNSVTSPRFLREVRPTVAICSSNYDNKFDHPTPEIQQMLWEAKVPLFTTKTGDVIIESIAGHSTNYRVTNWIADSTKLNRVEVYKSKKGRLLTMNADSIRNYYHPGYRPRL